MDSGASWHLQLEFSAENIARLKPISAHLAPQGFSMPQVELGMRVEWDRARGLSMYIKFLSLGAGCRQLISSGTRHVPALRRPSEVLQSHRV